MDGSYRFDDLFIKTGYLYGKPRYGITINVTEFYHDKNIVIHNFRYVIESTFHHNNTDVGSLTFTKKIKRMSNKHLTYKDLVYV